VNVHLSPDPCVVSGVSLTSVVASGFSRTL
jgi:hypothetical protein